MNLIILSYIFQVNQIYQHIKHYETNQTLPSCKIYVCQKKTLALQLQFYLCQINLESWHSANHHPCLWTKCRNDSEAWNDTEVASPLKQELQIVLLLGGRANYNVHTWCGFILIVTSQVHNIWKKSSWEEQSTYIVCSTLGKCNAINWNY